MILKAIFKECYYLSRIKTQFLNFYLHICNYRVSENKTELEKKYKNCKQERETKKKRVPHFICGLIMCQVYGLDILGGGVAMLVMLRNNVKAKYHLYF